MFGEADKFFSMQTVRQQMTDFSIVQNHGHRFAPENAIRRRTASRDWLAALWIHRHMHESFDYEVYGAPVVCNPRGHVPNALKPVSGLTGSLISESAAKQGETAK